MKYSCEICGWIYDPSRGDPDGNIPPGTDFADLPDDWVCPECGVPQTEFHAEPSPPKSKAHP